MLDMKQSLHLAIWFSCLTVSECKIHILLRHKTHKLQQLRVNIFYIPIILEHVKS